eukprot:Tbor_TRINITY_DN5927_c3_g1::TRINITY_DN5927_c3_g1_i15::g.18275::m.18275/K13886/CORO1B_1C_6; coronin-1B/1C/6
MNNSAATNHVDPVERKSPVTSTQHHITSKFRFVKATESKIEKQFTNVQPTGAIWDCANFMACNEKFIAVPWQQLGSAVVLRHDQVGKLPSPPPMFLGQSGHIIDLAFSPFDAHLLLTASEDTTIRAYRVPENGLTARIETAELTLEGHHKKCGILQFHPSANNILGSASADGCVKIWDLKAGKEGLSFPGHEQVMSLNWNLDGSLLNTTTKDKKVSILDSRTGSVVASTNAHDGSKTQRSIWAKRRNMLLTIGFSSRQARQIKVWDARNLKEAIHTEEIDQQSAVMMPFFDEDNSLLYLAGKGDTSIRCYEMWDGESTPIVAANTYSGSDPQKGMCMMPKTGLNVRKCEVARFHKLSMKTISSIQMVIPRRNAETEFQEDIFPPTFAGVPSMQADDFFRGKNINPIDLDLRTLFNRDDLMSSTSSLNMSPVVPTTVSTTVPTPVVAVPCPVLDVPTPVSDAPPAVTVPTPVETDTTSTVTFPVPVAVFKKSSENDTTKLQPAATNHVD